MSEHMTFLPKAQVLTLEEIDRIASAFVSLGTRKLRLTGGEPLVRKGFLTLVERLSRHLASGALDELTLTTNGTRLAQHAGDLAALGVRRVNVSLDTPGPRQIPRASPAAATWRRCWPASRRHMDRRAAGEDQHRRSLAHDNAAEIPITDRVGACPRHGPDPDRNHADG